VDVGDRRTGYGVELEWVR